MKRQKENTKVATVRDSYPRRVGSGWNFLNVEEPCGDGCQIAEKGTKQAATCSSEGV